MSWEGAAVPNGVGAEVLWGQGKLQNKEQLPLRAGEAQQRPWPQGWCQFLSGLSFLQELLLKLEALLFPGGPRQVLAEEHRTETLSL